MVGVIALIVFGPQRLPELARSVGRVLAEFRRQATEIRTEFAAGLDDDEEPPPDEPEPATPSAGP